jgi:hypothetical protein
VRILTVLWVLCTVIKTFGQEVPKVYITSRSAGNTWGAVRDQSHELAKDFGKDCPDVQVTTNQGAADYQVDLNHIEVGLFVRDNQLAVTDMFGNVLATSEKNSIKNGAKGACVQILADWSNQAVTRQKLINGVDAGFHKEGVMGYAEISGDKFTIHSERASAMRFHMALASQRVLSMMHRAALTMYIYTNDSDQNFAYDVKSGQVVSPPMPQTVDANK